MAKTSQVSSLTLFTLAALIACLCCFCYIVGRNSQLEQQLLLERSTHPRFDASLASGCYDIECVLRSDPTDANLYTFVIKTGEPHILIWRLDDQEVEYKSYWSPHSLSHNSELSVAVTPTASGSAIAVLLNGTTRLAFHDDQPRNAGLIEPMGNGYGSGGYYDKWSEPHTLIKWTGSHAATMTLHFPQPPSTVE